MFGKIFGVVKVLYHVFLSGKEIHLHVKGKDVKITLPDQANTPGFEQK